MVVRIVLSSVIRLKPNDVIRLIRIGLLNDRPVPWIMADMKVHTSLPI